MFLRAFLPLMPNLDVCNVIPSQVSDINPGNKTWGEKHCTAWFWTFAGELHQCHCCSYLLAAGECSFVWVIICLKLSFHSLSLCFFGDYLYVHMQIFKQCIGCFVFLVQIFAPV